MKIFIKVLLLVLIALNFSACCGRLFFPCNGGYGGYYNGHRGGGGGDVVYHRHGGGSSHRR